MSRSRESSIVTKCAAVMDVISHARQPLPFAEIVARTGFVKSSCHRILAVLQSENMIRYDKNSRMYSTGPRLHRWARSSGYQTVIQDVAPPAMRALSEITDMNVSLCICDDGFILYLHTSDPLSQHLTIRVGDRAPLHCTAAGKIFLAHMTGSRRAETLASCRLKRFTGFTKTNDAEIEAEILRIQARGYAMAVREDCHHTIDMCAPIRDAQGDVSAGLSVWTIADNATPEQVERFAPELIRSANELSALLGWRPGRAVQHAAG